MNNILLSPYPSFIQHENIISDANDAFLQLIGATSMSDIIGQQLQDILNPDINEYLNKVQSHTQLEKKLTRLDGKSIIVNLHATPIVYNDIPSMLIILFDITEQYVLKTKSDKLNNVEEISRLTGGFAHDYNNVLMVISGNLELLKMKFKLESDSLKYLQSAMVAVNRGSELTKQLLAFSRKQRLNPSNINVKIMINDIIKTINLSLNKSPTDMTVSISPNIWNIWADQSQLESAIKNIIINAKEAALENSKLSIEASNVEFKEPTSFGKYSVLPGSYVAISIIDNGIGISPEILDHVFEPYFTTKDVGKGSGLGLSMVYGFIKQSNGYVFITSDQSIGTTVTLYLPKSEENEAIDSRKIQSNNIMGNETKKILIVEDEQSLRELIVNYLEDLKYITTSAGNGVEAMNVINQTSDLDMLITDIVMPCGVTGVELADQFNKKFAGKRIILMSGYPKDLLVGIKYPILSKPFKMNELADIIRDLMIK